MIRALALILSCQLVGEVIARALDVPAPGPVLGMALLWALMAASPVLANLVRPVGEGILRHLSLLFVPAGVGVVGHVQTLGPLAVPLTLAIVVSTLLAIAVGAAAFAAVARIAGARDD